MKFLFFLVLIFSGQSFVQSQNSLGVGIATGYKSSFDRAAILVNYEFKNRINLFVGVNSDKYSGYGWSSGADFYFRHKRAIQPYVSFEYNYQKGKEFFIGEFNQNHTNYLTSKMNRFNVSIGLRFKLESLSDTKKDFLVISPFLSYRFYTDQDSVVYVSGLKNMNQETQINKTLLTGFGLGIRFSWYFKNFGQVP